MRQSLMRLPGALPRPGPDEIDPAIVRMARLMDEEFNLPWLNRRVGLDGIVGLIPVIGDVVTGLTSVWMIREARRLNVPFSVRLRMMLNYLIDIVVGAVPLAGNLFDFAFKANKKNLALIRRHLDKQSRRKAHQ